MKSIVLIDDDPAWTQAATTLLHDDGFEVRTAANGEEALEVLAETSPQLVILDLGVPFVGGLDVLQELRRREPRVPVIVVTANEASSAMADAMARGATGFLHKPVAPGLLIRAVRRFASAGPDR